MLRCHFSSKRVPETYIDIIRNMYLEPDYVFRTGFGDAKSFLITVAVHEASIVTSFLLSLVLDVVSQSIFIVDYFQIYYKSLRGQIVFIYGMHSKPSILSTKYSLAPSILKHNKNLNKWTVT